MRLLPLWSRVVEKTRREREEGAIASFWVFLETSTNPAADLGIILSKAEDNALMFPQAFSLSHPPDFLYVFPWRIRKWFDS